MSNREAGVRSFRKRLAVGIRDTVLSSINDLAGLSRMTGIPEPELGLLADLREDERQALACVVARGLDHGIFHFLYGLDNEPGFKISYEGVTLNRDERYDLTNKGLPPIWNESAFDESGSPRG
jgi:hypothetical protein